MNNDNRLRKDGNKNPVIALVLLITTWFVGGHRIYTQGIKGATHYMVMMWGAVFLTNRLIIIPILIYELVMLPRIVLVVNGDIDEDKSSSILTRILDFYQGPTYKKELTELRELGLSSVAQSKAEVVKLEGSIQDLSDIYDSKKEEFTIAYQDMKDKKEGEFKYLISRANKKLSDINNNIDNESNHLKAVRSKLDGLRVELSAYDESIRLKKEIVALKKESVYWTEINEEESNGIFTRADELYPSEYYKEELKNNRARQRHLRANKEATDAQEWSVEGSLAEGKKFSDDNIKKILRSFDNETDVKIKTLTFRNYNSKLKALRKSYEQLNKINESTGVSILPVYLRLKEQELQLAYNGLVARDREKEILREERAREREEKRTLKEINDKKKLVDKDITHYSNALIELQNQLSSLKDENKRLSLLSDIEKLKDLKEAKEHEREELDYRDAHAKAGYVYIISNIGSFGKDIVKIGVTRRLDPDDRIRELSSASVPFKFDVHAMIFSIDAYKLESELHDRFNHKRVNLANKRKEFFRVSIEEVKDVLDEYDNQVVRWNEDIEALEYNETLKLRANN